MRLGLILCAFAVVILALSGPTGPCGGLGIIVGLPLAVIGWLTSVVGLGLALNQDLKLVLRSAAIAVALIVTVVLFGNAWGAWNVFEDSWVDVAVFAWAPMASLTILLWRSRKGGI